MLENDNTTLMGWARARFGGDTLSMGDKLLIRNAVNNYKELFPNIKAEGDPRSEPDFQDVDSLVATLECYGFRDNYSTDEAWTTWAMVRSKSNELERDGNTESARRIRRRLLSTLTNKIR